jgi:Zn-dependent peptidase ImmA (M78 family)
MVGKTAKWESDLWSYLSRGDGRHCPFYDTCQLKQENFACSSEEVGREIVDRMHIFIDDDGMDLSGNERAVLELQKCPKNSNIFELVAKLARKYRSRSWDNSLPVPDDLIPLADDNLPIEVRHVPLKVYHGAIWRLSDCWVIQLNSYDTPARQRFTLYHEIFHILAHCKTTPVFKKRMSREGFYNEILADHFSTVILLPRKQVMKTWPEVKDIDRLAAIFNVPKPVAYLCLRGMRLI